MNAPAANPWISKKPLAANAEGVTTHCVLCSHACGVHVDIAEGEITKVRPDKSNPFSRGHICNKAPAIAYLHEHGDRVRHPLRRTEDGGFQRITWDQAIEEIAAKIRAIYEQHGPSALALAGMGGQGNHLGGGNLLALYEFLGSRRWFCAYAQEKTQHHLIEQWMFDAPHSMMFMADGSRSTYMLEIGINPKVSNLARNHVETDKAFKGDRSRKRVVVDPRVTDSCRDADRHIQLKPGTDAYFLLAFAATLVQRDLLDRSWLDERTEGYDRLCEELAGVDVAEMARRCEIEPEVIVRTATEFAAAPAASIEPGLGAEHCWFSTCVSYLVRLILSLTGNVGRAGGNVFYGNLAPPMHMPDRWEDPPRTVAAGIRGIRALAPYHMFSPALAPEEILVDHPDRIRALHVDTSNPLLSYTDAARWREAVAELDLLVVVDMSMTETARLADYVLPPAGAYQKWEYCDFPRRWPEVITQLRQPIMPIADNEDVLPECEIYHRIAKATGLYGEVPEELIALGEQAAASADGATMFLMRAQELATEAGDANPIPRLTFWTQDCVGPHLPSPAVAPVWLLSMLNGMVRPEAIKRTLGQEWAEAGPFELGAEIFRRIIAHPEGVEIARFDAETGFWDDLVGYENKKIRLAPEPMMEEIQRVIATDLSEPDPDYPFTVATGVRTRWTANTIIRDPRWRKGKGPHCTLHVNPDDARSLGIDDGAVVALTSRRATLHVPAEVDEGVRPGSAWIPNGFGMMPVDSAGSGDSHGVNANELTASDDRDPITGCPHKKGVRCKIEPLGA